MPENAAPPRLIPLWVKLAYTAFVAVLVPIYWRDYGPTNFLYFCDVALLMGLVAVWTERSLWASAPAVGILVPKAVWIVDFLAASAGKPILGVAAYMFDEGLPFFTRALSSFHLWLPFFLLWLLSRLGYDRRALRTWTAIALVIWPICFFSCRARRRPRRIPTRR